MSKWLLIAGCLLGLLTMVLVNVHIHTIESAQKGIALLRLKPSVSLNAGQRVEAAMVQTVEVPERFHSLTNLAIADTQESRAWILGRLVTQDVAAGALLLHEHFADESRKRFAARINKHKRAIAFPVTAASAVNYFVEPGSRVDILGTFEGMNQEQAVLLLAQESSDAPDTQAFPSRKRTTVTQTLLQNVLVLAVGRAITRGNYLEGNHEGFRTVTVEVSPEDAEKLTFALSQVRGGLTLVLRNPDDQAIETIPQTNWDTLYSR